MEGKTMGKPLISDEFLWAFLWAWGWFSVGFQVAFYCERKFGDKK